MRGQLVCMAGDRGGMCGRGMHGRGSGTCVAGGMAIAGGWYTSYWNAFLFLNLVFTYQTAENSLAEFHENWRIYSYISYMLCLSKCVQLYLQGWTR